MNRAETIEETVRRAARAFPLVPASELREIAESVYDEEAR